MSQHKFKVGQLVDHKPFGLGASVSARHYKVLRLLPAEGGDALERVAKEGELVRREQ